MSTQLKSAMQGFLEDWAADLPSSWRDAFGDAATDALAEMDIGEGRFGHLYQGPLILASILRQQPAEVDAMLARPNPFLLCNKHLEAMGTAPIKW